MTCSSAAVEPTSDSALPIRAELSGGEGKGTEILSPTNEQYEAHSSGALWGPREGRYLGRKADYRST